MEIKWAFIDLDGTLLNSKKKIPEKNLVVLKKFVENEGNIVIATGRWPVSAIKINKQIENFTKITNKYLISMNGSIIYNLQKKMIIYEKTIDNEIFSKILNQIFKSKIAVWIYSKKGIQNKVIYSIKIPIKKILSKFNMGKIIEIKKNSIDDDYVYKALFFTLTKKPMILFIDWLEKNFSENLMIVKINDKTIEVTAKNTSKGSAIKYLQKIEKFDINKTVALGDSQNDLSMFKVCKYKISFNASEKNLSNLATSVYENQKNFDVIFEDKIINFQASHSKNNLIIKINIYMMCEELSLKIVHRYNHLWNYLVNQNKIIIQGHFPNWLIASTFKPFFISKMTILKIQKNCFDKIQIEKIRWYLLKNKNYKNLIIEYKNSKPLLIYNSKKDLIKFLKKYHFESSFFHKLLPINELSANEINDEVLNISISHLNKIEHKSFYIVKSTDFYHLFPEVEKEKNAKKENEFSLKNNNINELLNNIDTFLKNHF